jgi:hypothetical protein
MRSCDDFCDLLDFQSSALWLFTVKNGFGQKSHFLRGIYHDENIDKIELGVGSEGFWGFEFVFCGFFGGFMKKIVWKYVVKGRV